ncbi:MAG: UDP-N-acetylmuramyl-tripeptide synthetase [Candidatus Peribacteraceae bacterium]|nr:UDP-N-acetylmuramyl-tripeptide synthetase [Candidatus Peribacteraceae bacterium]
MELLKRFIGNKSPIRLWWHYSKAFIAAFIYGFPARKLFIIGITGTDGKTTAVGMLAHILNKNGIKTGAASTAFFQINDEIVENSTHLTSISQFSLQKFLRNLVKNGCTHAVIEMSSHGLVQGRTKFTFPSIAAITNVTSEHLDYHGSTKQYLKDKSIIFSMLRNKGTKVLNIDDASYEYYSSIKTNSSMIYSPSGKECDVYSKNIEVTKNGCKADIYLPNKLSCKLSLPIAGLFNVKNALCATSCAIACNVNSLSAIESLKNFPGIPGRMERIDEGQDFSVFVDFAVSAKSYENVLFSLNEMTKNKGRVLVMCSSCGNRMKEKRPEIGRICSKLADVVVATEDETYGENPHSVLEEVWNAIDKDICEAHKIFDRKEAIEFLFNTAKEGDAVVLCGMGPFNYMSKLEGNVEWDERKIARAILKKMK